MMRESCYLLQPKRGGEERKSESDPSTGRKEVARDLVV
jgi:hypothetical protein